MSEEEKEIGQGEPENVIKTDNKGIEGVQEGVKGVGEVKSEEKKAESTKEPVQTRNERIALTEDEKAAIPRNSNNAPNINEIVKRNPAIEAKRKARLLQVMTGNLFGLKHGEYARTMPLYCNNCYVQGKCPFYLKPEGEQIIVCAIRDEFKNLIPLAKTRDKEGLIAMLDRLREIQTTRASMNLYFEAQDGGMQDKEVTKLLTLLQIGIQNSLNMDKPADSPQTAIFGQNVIKIINEVQKNPDALKQLTEALGDDEE